MALSAGSARNQSCCGCGWRACQTRDGCSNQSLPQAGWAVDGMDPAGHVDPASQDAHGGIEVGVEDGMDEDVDPDVMGGVVSEK